MSWRDGGWDGVVDRIGVVLMYDADGYLGDGGVWRDGGWDERLFGAGRVGSFLLETFRYSQQHFRGVRGNEDCRS